MDDKGPCIAFPRLGPIQVKTPVSSLVLRALKVGKATTQWQKAQALESRQIWARYMALSFTTRH